MPLLFATDFSPAAAHAATAAARLAAARKVGLWLVHVQPEAQAHALGAQVRLALEGALDAEAERLGALGADVGTALLVGRVHEALFAFAGRVGAELLVLGEPSGPPELPALGGSLDRVAAACPLPLLLVKDAAPFEAWALGRRPLRVMVGVDGSHGAWAARQWLAELRRYGPVEAVAGHAYSPTREARRRGLPAPGEAAGPALFAALAAELAPVLGLRPDGTRLPLFLEPTEGPRAEALVELARKVQADLLVVGTHHERLGGTPFSTSHHALRLAPMSVARVCPGPAGVHARPPAGVHQPAA